MLEYPLTKANRLRLAQAFRHARRVDLSIDCVIEGQMGKAFVDDVNHPSVYQIQTGPFVYLGGDPARLPAQELLRNLQLYTLLMPSAPGWSEAAQAIWGDRLRAIDRYQFSAENLTFEHLHTCLSDTPFKEQIEQMDQSFVEKLWGQEHFIDLSEYDSPLDFLERGIGYVSIQNGIIAGVAYASLVSSRGIEVSIYVEEDYRRKGLATALASHLLGWCLKRNLEPHWDAANPESCKLATKLGYKFIDSYVAHFLWKN